LIENTWTEIADIINKNCVSDVENYKAEAAWRKSYQQAKRFYEAGVFNNLSEDNYMKELQINKRELEKEKIKLQTEKLEYNRWLREESRDEMIADKICKAIDTLPPYKTYDYVQPKMNKKSYLLCIADAHYGVDFSIKDFYGNIINQYSPEIFEERMELLFYKVVSKIKELNIDTLDIFELGDGIDGIIRLTSQLMKLRYGVIESTMRYANFLANWINELSKYTRIKFHMCLDSNHCQLRLCSAPKNAFPEENMSKVMLALIKERLKNNQNVSIMENPTGLAYSMMSTYCCVGFHGEKSNLKKNLYEMSHIYGIHIDYTLSGHLHHISTEETGMDSKTLSVGSIIGVDPYGLSLNVTSNASSSMFEFEIGNGVTAEYTFKLN